MKTQLISLVTKTSDNKAFFTGAMSPVMACSEYLRHLKKDAMLKGATPTHIVRIWWSSDLMLNTNESGIKSRPEMTGYDTLAIIAQWKNARAVFVIQDRGVEVLPLVFCFEDNIAEYVPTQIFLNRADIKGYYELVPTKDEWIEALTKIFTDYPRIDISEIKVA
jgi:hypothetical protein